MRKGKWRQSILCGTLAAMMALGACAKEDAGTASSTNTEAAVTTEANVTNEGTATTENTTATQAPTTTQEATATPAPEVTTEAETPEQPVETDAPKAVRETMAFTLSPEASAPNCYRAELDGVREHVFTTTEYCFVESEKYFLCLDKDLAIPGDFAVNLDAIIEEIERQLDVEFQPDPQDTTTNDMSYFYNDFDPWQGLSFGGKVPIYVMAERDGYAIISVSEPTSMILGMAELLTDEAWDAFVKAYDGDVTRLDFVDYDEPIHEMTHVLTLKKCPQSQIFAEGLAVVYARSVTDALADRYPSIAETKEKHKYKEYLVGEAVNADNAERIFCSDYADIDFELRLAIYGYGKAFCTYLRQNFGDDFFLKLAQQVNADPRIDRGGFFPGLESYGSMMESYTEAVKAAFGADIFTKFGAWCVENNMIQK